MATVLPTSPAPPPHRLAWTPEEELGKASPLCPSLGALPVTTSGSTQPTPSPQRLQDIHLTLWRRSSGLHLTVPGSLVMNGDSSLHPQRQAELRRAQ